MYVAISGILQAAGMSRDDFGINAWTIDLGYG